MKKNRFYRLTYLPIFFGIITGVLAVLAQPLFRIQPPQAYGICTVCHARDLLNWISKSLFALEMEAAEVAINYPLLSTIGLLIGSLVSSKQNREFKLAKNDRLLKMFFLGIAVSNFGLLIISCPTRLFLRFSFGDPFAFLALLGLMAGIYLGVLVLRRF